MSGCDVCIGGFEGEYAEFFHQSEPRARKPHECSECGGVIPKGAKYQRCVGKNDGDFWDYDTCLLCAEIRKVFSCGEVETLGGMLWDSMRDYAFPNLTTASPCFRELSAEAKSFVLKKWQVWKGLRGR